MLTLAQAQPTQKFCHGVTRRSFLTAGSLSFLGLTLPGLLRLKAQGSAAGSHKAVIMILLPGGPSHIDMYDLKPDAPAEYRGEFKPIATKVPGMQICELMPLQPQIADKLAIVRNLQMEGPQHNLCEVTTGFRWGKPGDMETKGDPPNRPVFGAVVSRLLGSKHGMPPFVSMGRGGYDNPAFLGPPHKPFFSSGPCIQNLGLHRSISLDRLEDRKKLLNSLDTVRRDIDAHREMAGMDALAATALDVIASAKVYDAFDVKKEPEKARAKYGRDQEILLARRLVEAGVSVVTITPPWVQAWDTHGENFPMLRQLLTQLDRIVYTLVTDLYERGLDKDVAVVV